ncbi:MAG: response regulator transcription factor [Dehalococcoidia bacterium]|nr:response regulator transcription factor [Dehalococcoidia bacterium]
MCSFAIALATLLGSRPGLEIVAEVADGHAAIEATEQWHPDVVIMDVGMPRMNGIEATRQIRARFPVTKIVILSAYGDAAVVGEALAAGACGFIIKRSDIDELALALRLIATGNVYVSSELAAHMDIAEVTFAAINNSQTPSGLTAREREVLQLIAEGRHSFPLSTPPPTNKAGKSASRTRPRMSRPGSNTGKW